MQLTWHWAVNSLKLLVHFSVASVSVLFTERCKVEGGEGGGGSEKRDQVQNGGQIPSRFNCIVFFYKFMHDREVVTTWNFSDTKLLDFASTLIF